MDKEISGLKGLLKLYGFGGIGLNGIILIISAWIHLGANSGQIYSPMEACYYGMSSIINNNPDQEQINQKVIEELDKNKILFAVEGITLVKQLDDYSCDVVTKDSQGYRSFQVGLEKNSRFKHLYKILEVTEKQIESRYQR
ncbi:MAG: hypothetical protein A2504_00375 [Bdellovibrionales bacterium RIFOXYD12_FULL_39_22]|nr:MAG: hypothetical protein A2385_13955 [Bdellovibrionales bacterium RIFOXYB1_FULL_39_21]OFZ92891.1 MAG: hypothetical protein A2504_00375 [Bdellovibrionales bacterium RIFOXYD12_FULL_39_22]